MKRFLSILTLTIFLTSCASQEFIANKNHKVSTYTKEEKSFFLFWGLSGNQIIKDPQRYCSEDEVLGKVVFKEPVSGYFLSFLTFGFLQVRSIQIFCLNKKNIS